MEIYEGILYGLGGGILAELSGLYKLRQQALPDFLKSPFYWVTTIAMIGAGGGGGGPRFCLHRIRESAEPHPSSEFRSLRSLDHWLSR